jgi:hypothetical protein
MASAITHLAFTDEHNHDSGSGRYGSIASITMKNENYETISKKVSKAISDACVTRIEFKWSLLSKTRILKS